MASGLIGYAGHSRQKPYVTAVVPARLSLICVPVRCVLADETLAGTAALAGRSSERCRRCILIQAIDGCGVARQNRVAMTLFISIVDEGDSPRHDP
jgi:hypothetical protein